ncbi:MAG TPA: type III pantothenate kinase [Tepidisphaeraceae bacterium]|nr:type III pantothenate kinase [Tepidisphaeraceae bacterium]
MEINLVVLNVGNSRVAIGAFVAGGLEFVKRVDVADRSAWEPAIAEAWERVRGRENAEVAGASVNPGVLEHLELAVEHATGKRVEWVGREIELPMKVKTDAPEQTGVDRVLNVAAAYEQMGRACVVVDAGTALTINACNDAGEFLGGSIAPGASLMLKSLHDHTAKLPLVELKAPDAAVGRNTTDAIRNGVYHGIRGMVKEIVERYAEELGRWPEVIATGGDAVTLFGGWELVHAVSPDLTLYGIAAAYAEHHIKHND